MIVCGCDSDENNVISSEELENEECVTYQKELFQGNHIIKGGFDYLDADANSQINYDEVYEALNIIIEQNTPYKIFFTGESGKLQTNNTETTEVTVHRLLMSTVVSSDVLCSLFLFYHTNQHY